MAQSYTQIVAKDPNCKQATRSSSCRGLAAVHGARRAPKALGQSISPFHRNMQVRHTCLILTKLLYNRWAEVQETGHLMRLLRQILKEARGATCETIEGLPHSKASKFHEAPI